MIAQNKQNGGRFTSVEPLHNGGGVSSQSAMNASPDIMLAKNTKAQAQLAPLNHFSPAINNNHAGVGITHGEGGRQIANMPSLEQLATYNKLQPLNHVPTGQRRQI